MSCLRIKLIGRQNELLLGFKFVDIHARKVATLWFTRQGREPEFLQKYSELSKEELSHRIVARLGLQPFLTSNALTRMSLAGAQDKLGVRYDIRRGLLYDGIDGAASTHIVKPDSRLAKYQPSAINKFLCMTLAHTMKLPVPRVSFLQVPESLYVVERYDRTVVNGAIVCLHQMDACQLLGVGGDWKYERQGAIVSLKKLWLHYAACQFQAKTCCMCNGG